eukprot:764434-Hanusia_phi.AAC.1
MRTTRLTFPLLHPRPLPLSSPPPYLVAFFAPCLQMFITAGNLGAESDMFQCRKCKQKRTT